MQPLKGGCGLEIQKTDHPSLLPYTMALQISLLQTTLCQFEKEIKEILSILPKWTTANRNEFKSVLHTVRIEDLRNAVQQMSMKDSNHDPYETIQTRDQLIEILSLHLKG